MLDLIVRVIQRVRPAEGWFALSLAIGLIVCIQQLAVSAQIVMDWSTIWWAGLVALLLGRALGGWGHSRRPESNRRDWRVLARWLVVVLVLAGGGALWVLQSGKALPPLNLAWRDAATAGRVLSERPTPPPVPTPTTAAATPPQPTPVPLPPVAPVSIRWDSIAFLQASLPRFWNELQTAPDRGAAGGRMIAEVASVLLTWVGLLFLGIGLRHSQRLVVWSLPTLVAMVTVKLLGGGSGPWLVTGLALLLLLVLLREAAWREQIWLARKLDYASDLRSDMALWGSLTLICVVSLAVLLPFTFNRGVAQWLWSWFEPPSGIAALERTISENDQPQSSQPKAKIAGSTLPSIELGRSLEEEAPDTEALLVRVNQPLPSGPDPVYWRSRILTIYNGSAWYTNAQIVPDSPLDIPAGVSVNLIVQDVEDRRSNRQLIYGLPNVVGVNVPTNGERLADGTLAATTLTDALGRYRVFSQTPRSVPASSPRPDEQPDMTPYLQLPPTLPPRILDLARTITRDTTTPDEAALALERYLRELPYSYEVAPLLDRSDAVDQFLFSMRQGYCTYYASAFAVLARSLGIPARVSLGYATGSYDAATQTYTVYERDAHAWPELYLGNRWVAFEPTPVRPLPARDATQSQPQAIPVEPAPALPPSFDVWAYWPGALVLLVLVLALLAPWLPRLISDSSPQAIQRRLEQQGARAGVPWPPGATLSEYATLLRPRLGASHRALDILVDLLEAERYSGRGLSADQRGRLVVAWTAIKNQIRANERKG